ncbi:MAG: hypothetical protein QXY76_03230 [Nitrososphaeria archaeon]
MKNLLKWLQIKEIKLIIYLINTVLFLSGLCLVFNDSIILTAFGLIILGLATAFLLVFQTSEKHSKTVLVLVDNALLDDGLIAEHIKMLKEAGYKVCTNFDKVSAYIGSLEQAILVEQKIINADEIHIFVTEDLEKPLWWTAQARMCSYFLPKKIIIYNLGDHEFTTQKSLKNVLLQTGEVLSGYGKVKHEVI